MFTVGKSHSISFTIVDSIMYNSLNSTISPLSSIKLGLVCTIHRVITSIASIIKLFTNLIIATSSACYFIEYKTYYFGILITDN